ATLAQAREVALQSRRRFVFVLDAQQAFVGAIRAHDLLAAPQGAPAMGQAVKGAEAVDGAGAPLAQLLDREFPTVLAGERLLDVWQTVVRSPAERVPVLADARTRRVVGTL